MLDAFAGGGTGTGVADVIAEILSRQIHKAAFV